MNANFAFHALQDAAKTVAPQPAVNVSDALHDFAGQNAALIKQIGRAASNIGEAAYAGTMSGRFIRRDEFDALKRFVAALDNEFDLSAVVRRDKVTDKQHSPDESDFRDRERL